MCYAKKQSKYGELYPKVQLMTSIAIGVVALAFIITKWAEFGAFPLYPFISWLIWLVLLFWSWWVLRRFGKSQQSEDEEARMIN